MRAKKSRVGKILSYLCGLLILTASFLGAFWLPEYYSRWQDEMLLGQVQMEDRRNAGLPEEKDHSVAETIRAIQESGGVKRVAVYGRNGIQEQNDKEEGVMEISAAQAEEVFSQWLVCAEEWQRFGLLPQSIMDLCNMAEAPAGLSLYQSQETHVGIYWIQLKVNGNTLDFLMEQEGVCLLYFSIISEESGQTDWFAQEESIDQEMADGGSFHIKEYCQAEYALLDGYAPEGHYGIIRLLYGDFESIAIRGPMYAYDYLYSEQGERVGQTADGFFLVLSNRGLEEIVNQENIERGIVYNWLY